MTTDHERLLDELRPVGLAIVYRILGGVAEAEYLRITTGAMTRQRGR